MPSQNLEADTGFDPGEHIDRLGAGCLLIAKDMLDPNFQATLLLLCQHSEEGSYGLVLNRPSHMPLSEVFDKTRELPNGASLKRRICIGGPVQPEELQILQVTTSPVAGSYQVTSEVFLGGYWNDLKDLVELDSRSTRMFLGYSGWGAGQLPDEIRHQAWEVWHVDVKKLLLGPDEAWMGGVSQLKAYLSTL